MDEHGLARTLGWVSIGLGLALVAVPGPLMNAFGLGDRPNLGRFLGARDIVLGTGLLRSQNMAAWCRARGIAGYLRMHRSTVHKVLRRWVEEGVEGLEDRPHGRPPGDLPSTPTSRKIRRTTYFNLCLVHLVGVPRSVELESVPGCARGYHFSSTHLA